MVRIGLFGEEEVGYTGITCLMGAADVKREKGICFLSSATSKCHGCFYPTGNYYESVVIF